MPDSTRYLTLVRHGNSVSNAGLPSHDASAIELTKLGHEQARRLAATWPHGAPDLVVVSPMLRSRQTAEPLIQRFGARIEEWAVQEFTYLVRPLEPTTAAQRRPLVQAYFERLDPVERAPGSDTESFKGFMARVSAFGRQVAARLEQHIVVVTHGGFMLAFDSCVSADPFGDDPVGMWRFQAEFQRTPSLIQNGQCACYRLDSGTWVRIELNDEHIDK